MPELCDHWGEVFWIVYSVYHGLWSLQFWIMEVGNFPHSMLAFDTVSFILSGGSLLGFQILFLHTGNSYSVEYWGIFCVSLELYLWRSPGLSFYAAIYFILHCLSKSIPLILSGFAFPFSLLLGSLFFSCAWKL